jgi:hypothetical protein
MAYQKLQVGRALKVIPSNNNEIPFPALTVTSANTSVSANQLVDTAVNFTSLNVQPGDIIYNNTSLLSTIVVSVASATVLNIQDNIFTGAPESYSLYQGVGNEGCVLYVGIGGNLRILTVGGDDVTLEGVNAGQFIPVQVLKVFSTGTLADKIVALW